MNSELTNKTKKPLKWNEENLSQNAKIQQAILENMKQKNQVIDEPKTPYRFASSDEEEESFQNERFQQELADALNQVQDNEEREWGESSEDEDEAPIDPEEKARKEAEFKKKKQLHYNEYQMLQKFRQQKKTIQDEEDEDDDEIKELFANPPKIIVHSKTP